MIYHSQYTMQQIRVVVIISWMVCVLIHLFPGSSYCNQNVTEYQLKAVFLYNLSKFTKWQSEITSSEDAFIIGIYGTDPFGNILDTTVAKETRGNQPIKINRYTTIEELKDSQCNILFISNATPQKLKTIQDALPDRSVLTVSDVPGFAEYGGMVNLLNTGEKIIIEINHGSAVQSGIKISSKLLRLARIIK